MTFSRRYRSFNIIILLTILSMNVLNQSIYSQESKEDGSDLPSNNNDLLVYMESAEEIVGTGDQVDFIITVTDSKCACRAVGMWPATGSIGSVSPR